MTRASRPRRFFPTHGTQTSRPPRRWPVPASKTTVGNYPREAVKLFLDTHHSRFCHFSSAFPPRFTGFPGIPGKNGPVPALPTWPRPSTPSHQTRPAAGGPPEDKESTGNPVDEEEAARAREALPESDREVYQAAHERTMEYVNGLGADTDPDFATIG